MSALIAQYAPNRKISHFTTSTTGWQVLSVNNATNVVTGYSTLAALRAAAATAGSEWPGLDFGTLLQYVMLRSENGTGGDGSAFYVALNKVTAPNDDDAMLVSGAGQNLSLPGPINNIWVRKSVAGDEVILMGGF